MRYAWANGSGGQLLTGFNSQNLPSRENSGRSATGLKKTHPMALRISIARFPSNTP